METRRILASGRVNPRSLGFGGGSDPAGDWYPETGGGTYYAPPPMGGGGASAPILPPPTVSAASLAMGGSQNPAVVAAQTQSYQAAQAAGTNSRLDEIASILRKLETSDDARLSRLEVAGG